MAGDPPHLRSAPSLRTACPAGSGGMNQAAWAFGLVPASIPAMLTFGPVHDPSETLLRQPMLLLGAGGCPGSKGFSDLQDRSLRAG